MSGMRRRSRPVVLVTGAGGQVGRELLRAKWPQGVEICGFGSDSLDIANRPAVNAVVAQLEPDVIINAAAYTNVDQAEAEPERAEAVNATGVATLAEAANEVEALLIHLSTDYVFDGSKEGWYRESDPVNPLGVYGSTKAAGERAAQQADNVLILRSAWVYGALGRNFVTTMLRLARERDEIGVVDDQIGCPTGAGDLARAIVGITEKLDFGGAVSPSRLYHLAGPDAVSWYEFANAIFARSRAGFSGTCEPLTTADYPTPARRPANSRLDSSLIKQQLDVRLPDLDRCLSAVIRELEHDGVRHDGSGRSDPDLATPSSLG